MSTPAEPSWTVYVVDDDAGVREGLRSFLGAVGYNVVTFSGGAELLRVADTAPPGCVVMDLRMPDLEGSAVQERLATVRPDLPVILITGHGEIADAVRALKGGAVDFLEKPFEPAALLQSLEVARSRRPGPAIVGDPASAVAIGRLTPRERQVLEGLVEGASNKELAKRLGGSPRTVEIHRARVMAKLGAHGLADLVRIALRGGLTTQF